MNGRMDGWMDVPEGVGWLDRNFPATYVHLDVQHDPLVLLYMDSPDTVLAFVIGLGPVRRQDHSGWICDLATTHSWNKHTYREHMILRSCLQNKLADYWLLLWAMCQTRMIRCYNTYIHTYVYIFPLQLTLACLLLWLYFYPSLSLSLNFPPRAVAKEGCPPESWSAQGFLPQGNFSCPLLLHACSTGPVGFPFDCAKFFEIIDWLIDREVHLIVNDNIW